MSGVHTMTSLPNICISIAGITSSSVIYSNAKKSRRKTSGWPNSQLGRLNSQFFHLIRAVESDYAHLALSGLGPEQPLGVDEIQTGLSSLPCVVVSSPPFFATEVNGIAAVLTLALH